MSPRDERTDVRRLPEKQVRDLTALHAILDEALHASVGLEVDGQPFVLPMACARDGDTLESVATRVGTTAQAYLRVPIGVAISVAFLGEILSRTAWIGLACVVLGVAAMTIPARRPAGSRTGSPSSCRRWLPTGER